MKNKLFAAALAAVTLAVGALPAAAQDFRGDGYRRDGYQQDFRGDRNDWRMRAQITVRQDGRLMSFDRRDRMFYRLMDRPFNFQPGMTYVYTNRCSRDACMVLAFAPYMRGPVDRMWVPRLGRFFFAGDRNDRYDGRGDGRWDNRGDDGRFDGGRDYRGDRGDDRTFQDGPR
ncbi:MAG: hypothetical protein HY054_14410 [Proteobacteria bacterium]|nr:hypothetical protein [Pseudomonadota bacterium]